MLLVHQTIPTAQEQLRFLKHIQQILQSGTFTSTYKFALLMSLTRLAIEQGQDSGESLSLSYQDIAEKFIDLYWKQSLPFQFNQHNPFILQQSTGKQASIVNIIRNAQQKFKTIAAARKDILYWTQLKKSVAVTVKQMPVIYLQNVNGQTHEFLYRLQDSKQQLILLPQVMYCLRQFSEIIEELCQKRWIDYIRANRQNLVVLDGLPDLNQFMFAPSRSQLNAVANVLVDLQESRCFYCNKSMKKGHYAVDHFIPWSLYPADTGHNFVLADNKCNSHKSNYLASENFRVLWEERNHLHDNIITKEISQLGFLTDLQRSHRVADWAYRQGEENQYVMWNG
jgi:5-methylcytosine-specific restriction endonuclease McrA